MVKYTVEVNGKKYEVDVENIGGNRFRVTVNGKTEIIEMVEEAKKIEFKASQVAVSPMHSAGSEVKAEMSGTIVRILVKPGENVKKGQPLLVLEAMKMENEITSPFDGKVSEVLVSEGSKVQAGDVLVRIESGESKERKILDGDKLDGNAVKAEMSGTVVRIVKKEGEEVKKGEAVLILEAMKMENEITAPSDGVVSKIFVREGDKVQAGNELFLIS